MCLSESEQGTCEQGTVGFDFNSISGTQFKPMIPKH